MKTVTEPGHTGHLGFRIASAWIPPGVSVSFSPGGPEFRGRDDGADGLVIDSLAFDSDGPDGENFRFAEASNRGKPGQIIVSEIALDAVHAATVDEVYDVARQIDLRNESAFTKSGVPRTDFLEDILEDVHGHAFEVTADVCDEAWARVQEGKAA